MLTPYGCIGPYGAHPVHADVCSLADMGVQVDYRDDDAVLPLLKEFVATIRDDLFALQVGRSQNSPRSPNFVEIPISFKR